MESNVLWGIALALSIFAVLGVWFHRCGRADEARRMRPFAMRTLAYAGAGFVVGLSFLTSDLGTAPPEGRMGIVALTVGCFLLVYSAGSAAIPDAALPEPSDGAARS